MRNTNIECKVRNNDHCDWVEVNKILRELDLLQFLI